MRRALVIGTLAVGVLIPGTVGYAVAAGSVDSRRAVYRQVDGSARFPSRVIIRCDGWAEDSAARLRLVDFDGDTVIYRCVTP